jgi:hypothetical protein
MVVGDAGERVSELEVSYGAMDQPFPQCRQAWTGRCIAHIPHFFIPF